MPAGISVRPDGLEAERRLDGEMGNDSMASQERGNKCGYETYWNILKHIEIRETNGLKHIEPVFLLKTNVVMWFDSPYAGRIDDDWWSPVSGVDLRPLMFCRHHFWTSLLSQIYEWKNQFRGIEAHKVGWAAWVACLLHKKPTGARPSIRWTWGKHASMFLFGWGLVLPSKLRRDLIWNISVI